jgi:hypothetical protein
MAKTAQKEQETTEQSAVAKSVVTEQTAEKPKSRKEVISKYSVDDFVNGARQIFKCSPDCVRAAFVSKGITEATREEAQIVVKEFMTKEVK